jgi:hypothetical protein
MITLSYMHVAIALVIAFWGGVIVNDASNEGFLNTAIILSVGVGLWVVLRGLGVPI